MASLLATRVLEVENGAITAFEGNYEDYLRKKESLAGAAAEEQPQILRLAALAQDDRAFQRIFCRGLLRSFDRICAKFFKMLLLFLR